MNEAIYLDTGPRPTTGDPDILRDIANWLDRVDDSIDCADRDIQDDLRRIADRLEAAIDLGDA